MYARQKHAYLTKAVVASMEAVHDKSATCPLFIQGITNMTKAVCVSTMCLQALSVENDSDADNNHTAGNPAAKPAHMARPAISSNLHLSHGLDPFEVPPFEELTDERLAECLKSAFGYGAFRGQQLEVVRRVLEGKSTLAVLPTGKSSAVVVSPSLAHSQAGQSSEG